ncbi:kinase-like domain-containing protein [Hypoxylon fuscum]|nr:kinase-like domain-containing protein [Hypoxylon fuscum]
MAPLPQSELDLLLIKISDQLLGTPYSCSSLTRLVNGTTNFVFRGTLIQPLAPGHPSQDDPVQTVIVKHTTGFAALNKDLPIDISRCAVEGSFYTQLNDFPGTIQVQVPRLYLFDQNTNTQVLQDIPGVVDLKTFLVSNITKAVLSQSLATSVGYALGAWLRSFHSWTSVHSQQSDVKLGNNEPMRQLKYRITYDSFISNLEQFPDVLGGHREALEVVKHMATEEFTRTSGDGQGEEWGIIHGDFWTGNILIPETQQPTEEPKLFVVDWEFVQFGHRSYDIGQMIGDLCERKHFNDVDAALWVIDAFIEGYGTMTEDMAFRTAIHTGVQLITWVVRGPPLSMRPAQAMERAAGAMQLGMDMVLKGSRKDKEWLKTSVLAGLFRE